MKCSEETKKKISETLKRSYREGKLISPFKVGSYAGKYNPMYGKSHTEESKKKMSDSVIRAYEEGRLISPFKGRDVSGKNNPMYKKHHSEESKKKISETKKRLFKEGKSIIYWKGKHLSEESKKKISKTRKKLYRERKIIPHWKDKVFSEVHKNNLSKEKKRLFLTGRIIPWNKGMTGIDAIFYGRKHTEETKRKMKESRKYQTKVFTSKLELKIQGFLKLLSVQFIPHRYMSEIANAYQCDIFVPSLNLVIECDGDYWHGNPFKYVCLNQIQERQVERDKIRTKELLDKGFNVLRLWQEEINSMSPKDLKLIINKIKNC